MIRTMRKLTALLLTVVLVFTLFPGVTMAAASDTTTTTLSSNVSAFSKEKTLRILAIGNSFSVDGLHYLYQMAKSAGYNVVIGDLYAKVYSLSDHWEKGCLSGSDTASTNATVYTYWKISDETGGKWTGTKNTTMATVLNDERWDVITFQQASAVSGMPSSYQSVSWSCSKSGNVNDIAPLSASMLAPASTAVVSTLAAETVLSDLSQTDMTTSTADSLETQSAVQLSSDSSASSGDSAETESASQKQKQTITCGVGESGTSSSFSLDASAQTSLSYQSSDPSVLTVDKNGVVTLTGTGTAVVTITAAASDEYRKATAQVAISSQIDNYLSLLTDYAKKECPNKRVELGWQMTWAYAKKITNSDSRFTEGYANYNSDQSTMYQAIVNTVQTTVGGSNLFSFCVPTGTAIQNARSSYAGDHFNRDGVHLSYGLGRYIAGMTWAAALGLSPSQITYRPTGTYAVSSLDVNMAQESVTNAIETPWSVTKSGYDTKPTLKAASLKSLSNASGGLHLTWSKVSNATGYQIYRKTDGGSFSRIKTLTDGSATSYTDTAVKSKSGTTYTYYVKAYSGELITAGNSNQLRMTRLTAPTTVTVRNATGGVKVTWSKVAAATAYRVYRKTGSGLRTCITTTSNSTFAYTDAGVKSKNGTSYTYDVVACSKLGEGAASSTKTITRLTGVTLKSLKKSGGKLKLTWTRNSAAAGYVIYRKVGSGSWSKVKTITANNTLTYTDGAVTSGKTYSYHVCAYKGSDNSAVSNTKSIKR